MKRLNSVVARMVCALALWMGAGVAAHAMEQYIATREVVTSSGVTLEASTVVSVLGVNDVSRAISPSGQLLTFMRSGEILTADAGGFQLLRNDTNVGTTGFTFEAVGTRAKLCTTLYARDREHFLRPTIEALESYVRVTQNERPVSVSFETPTRELEDRPLSYASLRSSQSQLCINDLAYSSAYKIEFLKGLKAQRCADSSCDGLTLDKPLIQWAATRERPASLSLSTGKTLLPIEQNAFVPVNVVNIPEITVDVFKVDLRSLTNAYDLFSSVSGYSVDQLKDRYATSLGQYTVPVTFEPNRETRFNVDLSGLIPIDGTGIYFAVFDADALDLDDWSERATQWLIRSNVAVSTYHGLGATDVLLSRFNDMAPLPGAQLQVIAGNNRLLFEGTADSEGRVQIPAALLSGRGGHAPRFLLVNDATQGIALLEFDAKGTALNVGQSGVAKSAARDVYVTTDRELYRGGDTIHYFSIARSLTLDPLANIDVKVELISADDKVVSESWQATDALGTLSGSIELSPSARLGDYTLRLSGTDEVALANYTLKVQDFIPLTINTEVEVDSVINAGTQSPLALQASYFSGGPGAALNAEIQLSLKLSNQHEDARWSGYQFGTAIATPTQYFASFEELVLDQQGRYEDRITVDRATLKSSALYSLIAKGTTFDVGGRPNNSSRTTPIDHAFAYLGVKPLFEGSLEEGRTPSFKLANIDRSGQSQPLGAVEYVLREVDYDFDWYYDSGWRFRKKRLSDTVITAGSIQSDTFEVMAQLQWGRYELVVTNETGFETVLPFNVGWYGDTPITEPTELATSVNTRPDGTLSIKVEAPFAGTLRVMEAATDVATYRRFSVEKGANEVRVPRTLNVEPGFHILTTLVRPVVRGSEHLPQIAVGAAWVEQLDDDRHLDTQLSVAERLRSDEPVNVTLSVDRAFAKAQLFLVDEGIHAITRFSNADPMNHFFGQRTLGLGFRSNFGQLIQQDDSLDVFAVGGDESGGSASAVKSQFFKTVAKASPLLDVRNGQVEYSFDATDFEGQVRLVAVAVDERGIGFGTRAIQIQDPVSLDVSLPRFVGAGDQLSGKLALRFNEAVETIELRQQIGEREVTTRVAGAPGAAPVQQALTFEGLASGTLPVELGLTYPGLAVERNYSLVVREPSYPLTQLLSTQLAKPMLFGSGTSVEGLDLEAFTNTTNAQVRWSLSPLPGASMSQALAGLDAYPYGCIEQTSSGTRGVLAVASIKGDSPAIRAKINHGISRILAKQKANGAFGYWDRSGRIETTYLPYATQTLMQALPFAEDEKAVRNAIEDALGYLDTQFFEDAWTALYSYGVLANAGFEVTGRARYALDEQLTDALKDTDSMGEQLDLLSAGYWLARVINDDVRATRWANQIDALIDESTDFSLSRLFSTRVWTDASDLNSNTRYGNWHPRAGVLLAELETATLPNAVRTLKEQMLSQLSASSWRSTQDNANLAALLAIQSAELANLEVSINGNRVDPVEPITAALLQRGFKVEYNHDSELYFNAEIVGRRSSSEAVDNGFNVRKLWIDEKGRVLTDHEKPLRVEQGDIVTVAVFFEPTDNLGRGNLMLTDLLPSGFEIESATGVTPRYLDREGESKPLSSLQRRQPDWTESMDDRYTANFTGSWSRGRGGMVYYQLRATYPGEMVLPDAHVEFMYRPEVNGRSAVGQGQISVK